MSGSSQGFGMPVPSPHRDGPEAQQPPVRYVVLIDSASNATRLARLFLDSRVAVAEFEAAAPEVVLMTDGMAAAQTAGNPEWDAALAGHTASERAGADVYTLDI